MTRQSTFCLLLALAALAAGCEPPAPTTVARDEPEAVEPAPAAPRWQRADGSLQVALPADADDEELAAAIAEAQRTADDARRRWALTRPESRRGWLVEWAAETEGEGTEFVWVEPLHWSLHRVEGRIASPPQRPLAAGRGLGDLVGFPAGELVDWIEPGPGAYGEPARGGFTVAVLEARFGRPPAPDDDERPDDAPHTPRDDTKDAR
jgi:hypothetical protein